MPPTQLQPGGAAGARRGRAARAAQGPGRALPGRRRVHRRARGGACAGGYVERRRRRGPRRRARGGGPAATGAGSRSIALRRARARRARDRRLPPARARAEDACPTWSASAPATAAQMLQNAGFEVDVVPIQSDTVAEDRVAGQRPEPGEEADEGSTVTITVSSGPGEAPVPLVQGLPADEAADQLREAGFKTEERREFSDTVQKRARDRDVARGGLDRAQGLDGHAGRLARQGEGRGARRGRRGRGTRPSGSCATRSSSATVHRSARTTTQSPAPCSRRTPPPARELAQGDDASTLVVAKAPAEVHGAGRDRRRREDDATPTLEDAGFEVQVEDAPVDTPDEDGIVIDQDPGAPTSRAERGSTVTITVGRFEPPTPYADADRDARADAMRVAVLHGGRSSEHEVSLASAEAAIGGLAAGGPRRACRCCSSARALARPRRRRRSRSRPAAGCSAPTPRSRCCTARSARTARCRACSSCSTCPTSARACSPRRCAWTRSSSRTCSPPRASRRSRTRPCASRAGATDPDAVRADARARSGCPCSSSPRGSARRSGSRRCATAGELDAALEGAFAHDGLVIAEAFSAGIEVECAVMGLVRGRGLGAGRGRPARRRRVVRLRGEVLGRRRASSQVPGADLRRRRPRTSAGWPSRRSCASAAPAWRGSTSSSRTAGACSSTSSTRCRG